jgi:beta-glucanase (GH16 family)
LHISNILSDTNSANVSSPSTNTESHVYTIDWTQDAITWYVDGVALRTKERKDTWNATSGRWEFPQTPSRIELSLWPAGLSSNAKGTIDWAGGLVDWNSQYMQNGYYYALVTDVTVECYDPPAGAQISGSKSYVYTDRNAYNTSVKITDDVVVLSSLYASGDNATYNPYGTSSPASQPSDAPQTVPGVSGIGTRGDVPGGTNNPAAGSSVVNGTNGGTTFSQGGNSGAISVHSTGGSAFAVLVAVILGCFWL